MNYTFKKGKYIPIEETFENWKKLDNIAKNMYSKFRKSSDDISHVAKNTGWDIKDVEQIKNHMFLDELRLDDRIGVLDPEHKHGTG